MWKFIPPSSVVRCCLVPDSGPGFVIIWKTTTRLRQFNIMKIETGRSMQSPPKIGEPGMWMHKLNTRLIAIIWRGWISQIQRPRSRKFERKYPLFELWFHFCWFNPNWSLLLPWFFLAGECLILCDVKSKLITEYFWEYLIINPMGHFIYLHFLIFFTEFSFLSFDNIELEHNLSV